MKYYFNSTKYKNIDKSDITKHIIPLYDISKNRIVFINKRDIDAHIIYNHFRPPIKRLLKKNTRNLKILKHYKINKIQNLISKKIQKNLTYCQKPSYIYIRVGDTLQFDPYYSKSEIINLALNNKLITKDKNIDIVKLCKKLSTNQFQKINILKHAKYIQEKNGMYIIRYYTFVGDGFINNFMRNLNNDQYNDKYLINNIKLLWKLISNAPALSNNFSVYRRISFDYLSYLNEGDIYILDSFMSTTRNPLYEPDGFTFGNIVIKVNIPKNKKGSGLMLELYSHFPEELEFLIPPNVELRLKRKNFKFFHQNKKTEQSIVKTYEFDLIKVNNIDIPKDRLKIEEPVTIDFIGIANLRGNLHTKINTFIKKDLNNNLQFSSFIGQTKYVFHIYMYDSTDVYKDLYKYKTSKGLSIVHQNASNGQICLFIELGKYMYVNYHVNYYDIDQCPKFIGVDDKYNRHEDSNYLFFLKSIAKKLNISKIYLYPNRISFLHFYKNIKNKNLYMQYLYRSKTYDKDLFNILQYDLDRFVANKTLLSTYKKNNIRELLLKTEIPDNIKKMSSYKDYKSVHKQNNLLQFYLYIIKFKSIKLDKYERIINHFFNKELFNNYYTITVD